ncbi:MAG: hypothetical protein HC852_03135 [Acaryochloridaceae cyanobacterium RU_4_10]|nr:hypothetical protein [Acaryochloridaceae cyanobacterium RU_4_10]
MNTLPLALEGYFRTLATFPYGTSAFARNVASGGMGDEADFLTRHPFLNISCFQRSQRTIEVTRF